MQTLIYIILVPMVYIAFAVFFIGTVIRLIKIYRQPRHPSTLQIFPEKKPTWLWALHNTFLFPSVRRRLGDAISTTIDDIDSKGLI